MKLQVRFSKLAALSTIFCLIQMEKTYLGTIAFLVITLIMHFNFYGNSIPAAVHELYSDYSPLDQFVFQELEWEINSLMIILLLKMVAIMRHTLKRMPMKMRQSLSFVMEIKEWSVILALAASDPTFLSTLTFFLSEKACLAKIEQKNPIFVNQIKLFLICLFSSRDYLEQMS